MHIISEELLMLTPIQYGRFQFVKKNFSFCHSKDTNYYIIILGKLKLKPSIRILRNQKEK